MFEWCPTNVLNLQMQMELAFGQLGLPAGLGCWKSTQGKVSASFSQGSLPPYCEQTGLYDHHSLACVVPSAQQGLYIQDEWPPIHLQPGWSAMTLVPQQKIDTPMTQMHDSAALNPSTSAMPSFYVKNTFFRLKICPCRHLGKPGYVCTETVGWIWVLGSARSTHGI